MSLNLQVVYSEVKKFDITISEDATIEALISKVCSLNSSLPADSTSLRFGGFKCDRKKTLKSLGIKNNNVLEQVKKELSDIEGLIVSYEPCMIACEINTDESKAKMPCGHVISRESMNEFLRSLIDSRRYIIECPGINAEKKACRAVWDFALCSQIGVLSKEERQEFEKGFAKLLIIDLLKAKTCPKCETMIMKPPDMVSNRVGCISCIKKNGSSDFCWICMKPWKGGSANECGNFGCGSPEAQLKILANCSLKDIGNRVKGVPEMRACPKCKTLIKHETACKHMECISCKTSFCFMCLSLKSSDGNWSCGGAYDPCPKMAPRQTDL